MCFTNYVIFFKKWQMHCLIKKIIFDTLRKLRDIIMRTIHLGHHIKLQLWIVQAKYRYFRGPFNVLFWFVLFFHKTILFSNVQIYSQNWSCSKLSLYWWMLNGISLFHWMISISTLKFFFFKLMTSYKPLIFVFTNDHAGF